jgi:hypothetical protein
LPRPSGQLLAGADGSIVAVRNFLLDQLRLHLLGTHRTAVSNGRVTVGDGADGVTVGDGADGVTAGDADEVTVGDGADGVTVGDGADGVTVGDADEVTVGDGADGVTAGDTVAE